jgi:hypothetical protein
MKRSALATYVAAAALVLGSAPAIAGQAGSRPNTTGGSSGTAAPRGGDSGSSSGSSSSAGTSSSSGSAAPRGGSGSSMPGGGGDSTSGSRPRSPERRGGDYAISRGADGNYAVRGGTTSSRAPVAGPDAASDRRAVPAYSRPREGRTTLGEAGTRIGAPVRPGGGGGYTVYDPYYYYYDPFYGPSRYGYYGYGPWYGGYGFGLGYFYDPWGLSYYSPYNDDYGYGGSYGRYSYNRGYRPVGQLRLKVNPKHGQVYVDGYYAGEVDSFDGVFQRLALEGGPHKVEIRAEGFETVAFEVMVTPGETVTYKGELKRR